MQVTFTALNYGVFRVNFVSGPFVTDAGMLENRAKPYKNTAIQGLLAR